MKAGENGKSRLERIRYLLQGSLGTEGLCLFLDNLGLSLGLERS